MHATDITLESSEIQTLKSRRNFPKSAKPENMRKKKFQLLIKSGNELQIHHLNVGVYT